MIRDPRRPGPPADRMEPGRKFSETLMQEFFRRSIAVTVLLSVLLSLTIPVVIYFFEIYRYKEESIGLMSTFVAKELEDDPWAQLEDPAKREQLSRKIAAYMDLSNLVEFKIWKDDGTLIYSFHDPDMRGKKFGENEDLEEALGSREPSAEVVDPKGKAESTGLATYEKLFEVYVPIEKLGQVLGAVEIYRAAPAYRFFGAHTVSIMIFSVLLFVMLYVIMHGTFRKTAQKILVYDRRLNHAYVMLGQAYFDTVSSLIKALEMRDMETEGHSQRVVALSMHFAGRLGLDDQENQRLLLGSYLHDIGKIGIPDHILLKKGKLTQEEREVMMTHIQKGHEVIRGVGILSLAADVVLYHHEKWDGSGYLGGLREEEIPLCARIFALVDVFDALRNRRPYKEEFSFDDARDIINGESGIHFDPRLVAIFNSMSEEEIEKVVSPESLMHIDAMIKGIFNSGV